MMREWNHGDVGRKVRTIIVDNFKILFRHLSRHVLSLATNDRETLSDDYKSEGVIVYDTTMHQWFEWTSRGWEVWYPKGRVTTITITYDSWSDGQISIPYISHLIKNPIVSMYIDDSQSYELVLGGVNVDSNGNITISSDLPFNGRVVIR